jgi:diguanylate cyclase (GGDEF)-like protein
MAELVGDTLVVVFFVAASGSSGIGWILMALPIIEAAIHFRLTGAFVHWMVMSGLTVGAFVATSVAADAPASQMVGDLEQLVDRLGVLLLVVIPGSYLAEQLLGEVLRQRRATVRARERSRLMERVTEAGHDITRLGGNLFETLLAATAEIGFEVGDVWAGHPARGWQRLASQGAPGLELPAPGDAGSALREDDLVEPEVAIDADDPDEDECVAIADRGLDAVARITLASSPDVWIALRVGTTRLDADAASQVMALRLLCGQASVALQNERLLDELRSTHTELEHQAMYDPLTGLANRAQFVGLLRTSLDAPHAEADRPTTLMFLDLNGFKAVNDRLGHNAGDELLVGVANRLVSAVGDRGLVARLGGDEFTVLVDPRCELSSAEEIADAVHMSLLEPFQIGGEQVRVGASVGIAHAEPGVGESEMLRRADVAMYAAKSMSGTWRTVTYTTEFDEQERRHGRLARAFKTALDRDELELAYQPIVDAPTGAVVGAEALLRWTHAELGPVPPPTILDIAELTGMVSELNRWVFHRALTDIAACPSPRDAPLFVAVNVSPEELELETLCDNMRSAIDASEISPRHVVVELSERIVAQARGSDENVDRLIGMGLDLALDDFGEGQTALAHLRGLPIRFLKLDRLFIEHAGESAEDRKILASVVALAHELGFSVIAEGIETEDHRRIVLEAGADLLQGYGLHRPMPVAALRRLIEHDDAPPAPVWTAHEPMAVGASSAAPTADAAPSDVLTVASTEEVG